jgi:hypothetical protein
MFIQLVNRSAYPIITAIQLNMEIDVNNDEVIALLRACPDLTILDCTGSWIFEDLEDVMPSCSKLAKLKLSYQDNEDYGIGPMLSACPDPTKHTH